MITTTEALTLAYEAGCINARGMTAVSISFDELARFANLVAAAARDEEREQCAKLCDEEAATAQGMGAAIYDGKAIGAEECAIAIRSRSDEAIKGQP